jgi:hypothetical protein
MHLQFLIIILLYSIQDMGDFVKSSLNKGVNTIKNLFRYVLPDFFKEQLKQFKGYKRLRGQIDAVVSCLEI